MIEQWRKQIEWHYMYSITQDSTWCGFGSYLPHEYGRMWRGNTTSMSRTEYGATTDYYNKNPELSNPCWNHHNTNMGWKNIYCTRAQAPQQQCFALDSSQSTDWRGERKLFSSLNYSTIVNTSLVLYYSPAVNTSPVLYYNTPSCFIVEQRHQNRKQQVKRLLYQSY